MLFNPLLKKEKPEWKPFKKLTLIWEARKKKHLWEEQQEVHDNLEGVAQIDSSSGRNCSHLAIVEEEWPTYKACYIIYRAKMKCV